MSAQLKVAVVGGGIFGVTAAVHLARLGHSVDLFERRPNLLAEASGLNQYRFHRGYHYPRSDDTARGCLESAQSFVDEYAECLRGNATHHYCIASRDSLTTPNDFLSFCDRHGLEYELDTPPIVRPESVDLCVKVNEQLFDPFVLRALAWLKLREADVTVHLRTEVRSPDIDAYDFRVLATYGYLNPLLVDGQRKEYQFEVCEKPVFKLPDGYTDQSVVIMDGPFMCIDPFAPPDLFVMGNAVHAIHLTNVGMAPKVDALMGGYLARGFVERPERTRVPEFLESASEFFVGIGAAEHVGSMYSLRTVLPDCDDTDARPTQVESVDDRTVTLFSGKIGTCVDAARAVANMSEQLLS